MAPRNIIEHNGEDGSMLSAPGTEGVAAVVTEETHSSKAPPMEIVWRNVGWMAYLHGAALIGLYLTSSASWKTLAFG